MSEEEEKQTSLWIIEPVWQNYSSMYREAVCSREARTGMEIAHHRMAALYFGIATLEAFLNRQMTNYMLQMGKEHDDIHEILRKGNLKEKLKTWPKDITGKILDLRPDSLNGLRAMIDLRGQLTHQKNYWPEAYEALESKDSMELVDLVAEFIISFHSAKQEFFPYWICGWNYLNPRPDSHEIIMVPSPQFAHSLRSLGFPLKQDPYTSEENHLRRIMSDYSGYRELADFLEAHNHCEPKWERFPFQPKLCRRWWDSRHHGACGKVTDEALQRALEIDREFGRPKDPITARQSKPLPLYRARDIFSKLLRIRRKP